MSAEIFFRDKFRLSNSTKISHLVRIWKISPVFFKVSLLFLLDYE